MKKLLFTFLVAMCCMAMNAQTFEVGGINYSVTDENKNTVEVVAKDSRYTGSVVIPATVTNPDGDKTYNVTGIGNRAFFLCLNLASITIPASVNSIGTEAFSNCLGLTSVTIPESVTSIGNKAFFFCVNLASVTIPKSVNSIGTEAFHACESLTSITIPKNVTSIGTDAFVNCKGLASITVAEENTRYGSPDNCNAIIEKSTHTLLYGCKNTVIPNTVTSINNNAFRMHTGLISITIPESVTSIGDAAFQSTGLTSVIIGKSVNTIGEDAFRNCPDMTEIDVLATTPPTLGTDAFSMLAKDIPVYVPDVDAYKKISWGGFTNLRKYVDLPIAKEEAITGLKTFINEEKIANAPIKEYADCINAATALKDIPSIVNDIKAEINNYTKFTLGEWKYLLDKNDEKYTIVGGSLTFTDKDSYQSDYDFTVDGSITYNRTFTNKNWQALYVPFSMDFSEWSEYYDIAEINNFIEYDDDGNGVFDRTYLVVLKKTSGSTEPNYPYLIRAKSEGTHSLVLTDKTLEAAACNSIDCSSVKHQYTFTGTYQPITTMYANGYYAMDGGKLQQCDAADVVLGAQRWYMAITSRTGAAPNKSHSIRILVDGEDTTEIEALRAEEGASRMYDLSGRMIDKQSSAHGVYIDGGKKIIK